ncbi:MAG TPA: FAD binding domain-containing protein [Vicinamibacteria bacterium]|nr:FAD binding domain-containing protein [Vicinamibacteria bacterium]
MSLAWSPKTLVEAREALARGATKVAGATDLLVIDHATGRQHESVLNVLGIAELQGIRVEADQLSIGAASTFTQIRQSPEVAKHAPLLAHAAATIGAAQIQNRATLGGNIANASPAGDSLPALLALGAMIMVSGTREQRLVPYNAFHTGYRKSVLGPDELIERVLIPLPSPAVQVFRKVGTRAAQAISKVVVGFASDRLDRHVLANVRLAMGSVAPVPVRLHEVEVLIEDNPLTAELADRAAALVEKTIWPIDDVRSTAEYRRHVAGQVVRRLLLDLLEAPRA